MSLKERLQRTLDPIAKDIGTLPFVMACVYDVNGPLYEFTTRTRDENLELISICSGTKPFTTTCLLQLYDRGLVDLEDPVAKWLPEASDLKILEGWDEATDSPILRTPKNTLKVFHVLTHTSGLRYPWKDNLKRYCDKTGEGDRDAMKLRDTWSGFVLPLTFEPGTAYAYGPSIDWAGKIVEAVSGMDLGAYMEKNFFSKLGIHDTTFTRLNRPAAPFYLRTEDGSLSEIPSPIAANQTECFGGQGLYSTVGDFAKFLRIFVNGGKSPSGEVLLSPEVIQKYVFTNVLPAEVKFPVLADIPPGHQNYPSDVRTSWTCNFLKNDDIAPSGKSIGSLTWAGASNVFFWVDPAKGIVGIWATQLFPVNDPEVLVHYRAWETGIYDVLKETKSL